MPILPCLVAFCQAFPPLYDDVAALLVQVGQVCASDVATKARDIDPFITRKCCSFSGWGGVKGSVSQTGFDRLLCAPASRPAVPEGEASGGHACSARTVQADPASEDSRGAGWSRP